jgi:hypothetical protein
MADITMCSGVGCPIRENCYRFTAPVNEHRQSMFMEIPCDNESKTCLEFVDNKLHKRKY